MTSNNARIKLTASSLTIQSHLIGSLSRRRRKKSPINFMIKSNYEFEVLVHGSSAKEYYHRGSFYIEGKEGTNFSLRLRNNSSQRVLFVPTIDGISVLNAKEGSFKSRGYIVDSHSSTTIEGWRTSDDKVAQFFFSSPKQSYAKRINKGGNLGVIGCAVFKEKRHEPVYPPVTIINNFPEPKPYNPPMWPAWPSITPNHTFDPVNVYSLNCSAGAQANALNAMQATNTNNNKVFASAGLGTGFGEDKYSPTVTVDFERENHPDEVFNIYYNTRENLASLGIEFKKPVYVSKTPKAFPKEDGYCPRPN